MMKVCLMLLIALSSRMVLRAQQLSLNGTWQATLDSNDKKYAVSLPGTLDDAGVGNPVKLTPELNMATLAHLMRKVQYTGKAYYTKTFTVPLSWAPKKIELVLARVIWKSSVWIDKKQITTMQ